MIKAVFLDRDSTINYCIWGQWITKPEQLVLLPCAAQAISVLNKKDFKVFVVTNQSGIAKGYFTEEDLMLIHKKLINDLKLHDAIIDDIAYCPHFSHINCECRKPKPGMLINLATRYNIDLSSSWMIGDRDSDIEAGKNAGCRTAKVSANSEQYPNLMDIVQIIIREA